MRTAAAAMLGLMALTLTLTGVSALPAGPTASVAYTVAVTAGLLWLLWSALDEPPEQP